MSYVNGRRIKDSIPKTNWKYKYEDAQGIIESLQSQLAAAQEALKRCEAKQAEALEVCRKHNFVFKGKGGRWEKLALTFYTDLCEVYLIAHAALRED